MTEDPMVAALLRERESYLRTARPERAELVDEQLATRGYRVDKTGKLVALADAPKGAESDPARTPPKARQAPQKRTT